MRLSSGVERLMRSASLAHLRILARGEVLGIANVEVDPVVCALVQKEHATGHLISHSRYGRILHGQEAAEGFSDIGPAEQATAFFAGGGASILCGYGIALAIPGTRDGERHDRGSREDGFQVMISAHDRKNPLFRNSRFSNPSRWR